MIDLKERAGVAMNVRGQLADPIADPKVTLGALAFADDLGRLLWRMKYGQDVKRSGLNRAILLLAHRIRWSGKFSRGRFTGLDRKQNRERRGGHSVERAHADIVERFARRVIVEWVVDQCGRCDGRGVIGRAARPRPVAITCPCCGGKRFVCISEEMVPFAARTDGRGPMVFREFERCAHCNGRGTVLAPAEEKREGRQICPHCGGSARLPADDAARASALGISVSLYREQWARYFHVTLAILDKVDGSTSDTVRGQLRA